MCETVNSVCCVKCHVYLYVTLLHLSLCLPSGTDATHAEHIEKIKSRNYVGVQADGTFLPGELGMGLVEGWRHCFSYLHLKGLFDKKTQFYYFKNIKTLVTYYILSHTKENNQSEARKVVAYSEICNG